MIGPKGTWDSGKKDVMVEVDEPDSDDELDETITAGIPMVQLTKERKKTRPCSPGFDSEVTRENGVL